MAIPAVEQKMYKVSLEHPAIVKLFKIIGVQLPHGPTIPLREIKTYVHTYINVHSCNTDNQKVETTQMFIN